jgi:hypothetical protein
MAERCIFRDYQLRGAAFEVWADGSCQPGMYPNWWLATDDVATAAKFKVPVRTVLTGEEFDPPLTQKEITAIGEAVLSTYTD